MTVTTCRHLTDMQAANGFGMFGACPRLVCHGFCVSRPARQSMSSGKCLLQRSQERVGLRCILSQSQATAHLVPSAQSGLSALTSKWLMTLCSLPGTTITFNASDANPLLSDTCGTWLLFNNLYGVTPFVDFCKITGNVCNEQGDLPWCRVVCIAVIDCALQSSQ